MLETTELQAIIKHRYPLLFIDRVIELEPGKKGIGLKNVTVNEPFFQGHFPEQPIMPGVLILECMAQMAAIVVGSQMKETENQMYYFTAVYDAKFLKPVVPGDQLLVQIEIVQRVKTLIRAKGVATVLETPVSKAELGFAVVPGK